MSALAVSSVERGRTYGMLTAIEPDGRVRSRAAWAFRCACGKEVRAVASEVKGGRRISCGCRYPSLVGQRFGELVVERQVENDGVVRGRRWLCRCDCGGVAERSTYHLRVAVRRGHVPSCRTCLEELNRGRVLARRERRKEVYRDLWVETGALYSDWDISDLTEAIREDLAEELGFSPEEETFPFDDLTCSIWLDQLNGERRPDPVYVSEPVVIVPPSPKEEALRSAVQWAPVFRTPIIGVPLSSILARCVR